MRFSELFGRSIIALAVLALATATPAGAQTSDPQVIPATTHPSQRLGLSFHLPGIVSEVRVREGDQVQDGQLLMAADDRMEQMQLQIMELEAKSTLPLEAAEADLAAKRVTLERVQGLRDRHGSSATELLEAELAVTIAELRVKMASQETAQRRIQADRQRIRVELMQLKSPIDGVIEHIETGLGEAVDPSRPSLVLVSNDPLWVEMMPQAAAVAGMNIGDVLEVSYNAYSERPEWHEAKIVFIAPVADAASGMHRVRLEMPNPDQRASGMNVTVRLPYPADGVAATE